MAIKYDYLKAIYDNYFLRLEKMANTVYEIKRLINNVDDEKLREQLVVQHNTIVDEMKLFSDHLHQTGIAVLRSL